MGDNAVDSMDVKKLLLSDREFRKSLILDVSKYLFNAFGLIGFLFALAIAAIAFVGYNSLGDIARTSMDRYLRNYAQPYEEQFNRLSQIPSYATVSEAIVINDTARNFVKFPFYADIERSATQDECQWFVTLEEVDGSQIRISSKIDTVDGIQGLRFTSTNKRLEPRGGVIHGPAGKWVVLESNSRARVFIFATRGVVAE